MQSRHYDPSLGRFIQADSLPLAGLTTQGMNRYIYCANDPVNASDPSGRIAPFIIGLLGALLFGLGVWLGIEVAHAAGGGGEGPLLSFLAMILGTFGSAVASECMFGLRGQLLRINDLAAAGLLWGPAFLAAVTNTLLFFLGGIFIGGFLVGLAIGTWLASAEPRDERFHHGPHPLESLGSPPVRYAGAVDGNHRATKHRIQEGPVDGTLAVQVVLMRCGFA